MGLLRREFLAAIPAIAAAGCARAESSAPAGSLQRLVDETGVPALAGAVVTPDGLPFIEVAGVRRMDAPGRVTVNEVCACTSPPFHEGWPRLHHRPRGMTVAERKLRLAEVTGFTLSTGRCDTPGHLHGRMKAWKKSCENQRG